MSGAQRCISWHISNNLGLIPVAGIYLGVLQVDQRVLFLLTP